MTSNPADSEIRVAQLLDSLIVGGAEQLAVRIANGRARNGHASFLYVLNADGPLRERVDPAVQLHFLDVRRSSIVNPFAFGRSLQRGKGILACRIHQDQVGIVQTHLPNPNFWGLLLEMAGVCRAVPTIHNNQEFSYGRKGFRSGLNLQAYRLMLKKCGAVVACSEEVRLSLLDSLGISTAAAPRLVAVPNGVDLPALSDPETNLKTRQKHGIPVGAQLVLAAGRLTDQKDFQTLVQAASLLDSASADYRLIIAGEGELRGELTDQISGLGLDKKVLLPGNLLDLPDLMQAADLFVLPSKYEGLPLVLLEAMSCGLPVIGSRIKGVVDVVDEGANGLFFEVGQTDQLAAAMDQLLGSSETRKSFGARSRELVAARFGFDEVLAKLDTIYRDIAARA